MAKLKLWVKNLIIILAIIISLVGVGVGVYFILQPSSDEPKKELSQQQKEYISAMGQTPTPDIDISSYDDLQLEDGTSIDAGDILYSCGEYVVVENKVSGIPEFYTIQAENTNQTTTSASIGVSITKQATASQNLVLKKINISSAYAHLHTINGSYAISGDYAIVTDGSASANMWVVSLKTGETVLQNNQINVAHLTSSAEQFDDSYIGSYVVSVVGFLDNFLVVERQDIVASDENSTSANILSEQVSLKIRYTLYPLDNVNSKLEFDQSNEILLSYKLLNNYLYVLTNKSTHLYSTQLSSDGGLQSIITLQNSFVEATQDDAQMVTYFQQYFKDVTYYDFQLLSDSKILIEKRTTQTTGENNAFSIVCNVNENFAQEHTVGISYLVYDISTQSYVQDFPAFSGKVEVLDSFVDGYYVLNQKYANGTTLNGLSLGYIYDKDFNFVLSYNADRYGTIVAYNGENFITSGKNSSTILSPWGGDQSHHAGYQIVSTSICDDYVVVKNDIYYSLYNTRTGYVYSDGYLFMSQIMNGKVLAYKDNTGYCIIDLASEEKEITPIYNFDTTKINGNYGINLYFASVGFYFTYTADNQYTYVGLDGITYKNIQTYSYKIIDDQVYLSLVFNNGDRKLIVSKMLSQLAGLSDEKISQSYLNNLTPPATQSMAIGDSDFSQIGGGGSGGGSSSGSSNTSSVTSVTVGNDNAKITASITENSNPTYEFSINSDMLFEGTFSDRKGKWTTKSVDGVDILWSEDYNSEYGIGVYKASTGLNYGEVTYLEKGEMLKWSNAICNGLNTHFTAYFGSALPISASIDATLDASDNTVAWYLSSVVLAMTPYNYVFVTRYDIHTPNGVTSRFFVLTGFLTSSTCVVSEAQMFLGEGPVSVEDGYLYVYSYNFNCLPFNNKNENSRVSLDYACSGDANYKDVCAGDVPVWLMEDSTFSDGFGSVKPASYINQEYSVFMSDKIGMFDNNMSTDFQSDYRIELNFTLSTFKSKLERYLGGFNSIIATEDYTYQDSSFVTLKIDKSTSDTNTDKEYSNNFTISMDGKTAMMYENIKYSYYANIKRGFWVADKVVTGITNESLVDSGELREEILGTVVYYRTNKISNIMLTCELKSDYWSKKNVSGADNDPKGSLLFMAVVSSDVTNNNIKYGFIQNVKEYNFYNTYTIKDGVINEIQKKNGSTSLQKADGDFNPIIKEDEKSDSNQTKYYIGSPRPNLLYYTYNCTFGHRLEGLVIGKDKTLCVDAVGIYKDTTSVGSHNVDTFLYLCGRTDALTPYQTPLTFDIIYNYLDPEQDNKVTYCTNKAGGNKSEGTTGAYKFNGKLSENEGATYSLPTFKDYDDYAGLTDKENNVLQSPKGWTFVGWAVGYGNDKGRAIEYSSLIGTSNYSTLTSPSGAVDMKLKGGEGFENAKSSEYSYKLLANDKTSHDTLKYLPSLGMDMTINSNAIKYSKELRTLNLTAVYTPKQYRFMVDVTTDGNWKEGSSLYYYDDDKAGFTKADNGQWSCEVYYNDTLTIPKMYVQVGTGNNAYYYEVVLYKTDETIKDTLDNSIYRKIHVDTTNLTEVLNGGAEFYTYDTSQTEADKNKVTFRAGLRAVEYKTTISGSQDSHVYGDASQDDVYGDASQDDGDYFHQDQKFVTSITVSGNVNKEGIYGTENKSKIKTYGYNNEKLEFTTPFDFISGQEYTLKFEGISTNYKVKVDFISGNDANQSKHTYYWNWAEEETTTKAGFDDTKLTLTINLDAVSGGTYGAENKVVLTITIDTAFFESTITVSENNNNGGNDSTDIGDISISDKYKGQYHKEKDDLKENIDNKTCYYYIGGGSTILLKCTATDMDAIIHGMNMSVNNSYLSGLKVLYNGAEKFVFDASKQDLDSKIATATLQMAQNPQNYYGKLYGEVTSGGRGFSKVDDGDTEDGYYIFNSDQSGNGELSGTRAFIKLLYDLDDEAIKNLGGSIYYTVIKIEDQGDSNNYAYLIITNHVADADNSGDNGTYYGMRACFVYNVGDNEANIKNGKTTYNTYQFNLYYTKINSTLTFDFTLNGESQHEGEKRYLTNSDSSAGGTIVKTDGNGKKYILIFGRKVYVEVDNDKKIKVIDPKDNDLESYEKDYNYLFGPSGILKNNIDKDGYLFVDVNKPAEEDNKTGLYWNDTESWFRAERKDDGENDNSNTVNIGKYEETNGFNFASVKPSNRFMFNLYATKGQIAKTITIYYNNYKYVFSFVAMGIDNAEENFTPQYKVQKFELYGEQWTGTDLSISKTDETIKIENMLLYLHVENDKEVSENYLYFHSIDMKNDSTLLAQIDIALISASAHISVDYMDYSVLVAGGNDVGKFGYTVDNDTINIVDESKNIMTTIGFNKTLELNDDLFVSRKNFSTNNEQNSCSEEKLYFIVFGGAQNATVEATFINNALYTVSIKGANGTNENPTNPSNTYKNTASWAGFDDEEFSTKMTVADASNSCWIASFEIGTKTISSSITSDIEFGYGENNSNVLEETLEKNLTDDNKDEAIDKKDEATGNGVLYETGDGQIASGGTQFNANMGKNFDSLDKWNYTAKGENAKDVKYGEAADLRGNQIIYTIATQYGYDWTGATLVIKVGINSSKKAEFKNLNITLGGESKNDYSVILSEVEESYLLITLENLTSTSSGDIVVSYDDNKTMKIGSIGWGTTEENLPTLKLTLTRASITSINLDLHYDAKEFDVIYDTSSGFGTSPVGVNGYADEDATNQTRKFTYNLKQDLNKGWGDELSYQRIGYDQLGWAYGAFYKDNNGKTTNNTTENLSTDNYTSQLYSITGGNGIGGVTYANIDNWYTSLKENYANVFGKNEYKITMYTIWQAKTYSLDLDYKANGSGDGSTTSTKYTAYWVFDMPITSANIKVDELKFDANEYTITNAISRVYRMGYTFNGWYYINGKFNGTDDYDGLVYLAHENNVLTTNDNSFKLALTQTSDKNLGYQNNTPSSVFGYSVYQAINDAGSWLEAVGETASSLKLYASWTANTYGFIYDLNGYYGVDNTEDNGYKSLKYDGTISANKDTGVGSSTAYLAFTNDESNRGVLTVEFDSNINEILSAYAYRKGYKFTGWYFSRTDDNIKGIAEGSTLDKDLLLKLLNVGKEAELNQIKNKINSGYSDVWLIETLGSTAINNGDADSNKTLETLSGNAILLHARWESLPYIVNIDLNNWNMADYGKEDSEYMAGDTQYTTNNTTNIQLELYFDKAFKDIRLSIDDSWLQKDDSQYKTTITRNGTSYNISGETAYAVLLQILTAYGYTLGNGEYDFTIYGNGNGEVDSVKIKNDTEFNNSLYDQLIYFSSEQGKNSVDVNKSNQLSLQTIDLSGQNKGDWHKDVDINDSAKVGQRTFTLFAIWTIKDIYLDNVGTKEEYSNALDETNTNQTLFIKDNSGNGTKQCYDETTYFKNTGKEDFTLGNIGSNKDGYKNNYYADQTYFLAPATGQYFSSLTIWFNDNYFINKAYSNQTRGKLTLTFEWNKVSRKLTITSATLEVGKIEGGKFVATYTAINNGTTILIKEVDSNGENLTTITDIDSCEKPIPVIAENGQSVKISGEVLYCFVDGIEISISKYMLKEDVSEKNINTAYQTSEWVESAVPTWLTDAGLKDVHYLTISVTGQKSNLVFDGTTMGQTFDVDYYRWVRPSDGMQTEFDTNQESSTYGQEIWDSQFVNDWSMYEVYKTETYRYGEYASTSYSYATNFAFSSWYFYQGHVTNYVDYANYNNADVIYQTHQSHLIPQNAEFVWDEAESKYVFTQSSTNYYLKDDSGNLISTKQNEQNSTTGWLLINADGSYQCAMGTYALYDFIGTWKEITYYWCTWTDNGLSKEGYVASTTDKQITSAGELEFVPSNVLDIGKVEGKDLLMLHTYTYKDSYKDYRYDNKAVSGNVSMVAVYVPAQTRKVHYYTWKTSGSATSGYEERTTTSNNYILGEKHIAKITDVLTNGGTKTFSQIKYWELGTNDEYYRIGFSGFSSFENGNPTEISALEFLMQFVNKNNFDSYPDTVGGTVEITYKNLIGIINKLGYGTMGEESDDVVSVAVKLYKELLKKDTYKAYKYLQSYEVVSNLGLNIQGLTQGNDYANIKALCNNLNINAPDNKPDESTLKELAEAIINKLSTEQLAVVLDKISMDYFGYVLKNPSKNIGYWPVGTYLAGWYMVPETLKEQLAISGNNFVLTFDSDNFVNGQEGSLQCLKITGKIVDPNGNTTYIVELNGIEYEVTRFNVFDENKLDILSRVETSVHIFAAYNSIKFEIVKTNGELDVDIKYAHNSVTKDDGNPYVYEKAEVRFLVLDEGEQENLAAAFVANDDIPTSLQDLIDNGENVYTLTGATKGANDGDIIIAFVYNLPYSTIIDANGNLQIEGEEVNNFAITCAIKENEGWTISNLVDKLNEIALD